MPATLRRARGAAAACFDSDRCGQPFDGLFQGPDPGVGLTQQRVKNLVLFDSMLAGECVCASILALPPVERTAPPVGSLEWLRPGHEEPLYRG